MKNMHAIIISLLELVDDLNRRSGDTPSDTISNFSISIRSPLESSEKPAEGSRIRIEITYESGGSEESSYVIQDAVELQLSEARNSYVFYEDEGLRSAQADVSGGELADGALLENIKSFCEARMPKSGPWPE